MSLSASLVEVRTLSSDLPRSSFDEQKIEQAARLIVEAEGIINPIVVSRTGINSFQVVDGHFEYYAATRARELNLEVGEAIAAYVIAEDNEATVKEQIAIFRQPQVPQGDLSTTDKSNSETDTSGLSVRLTNLESRIENRLGELKREHSQKNQELKHEIDSLKQKLPEKIEPLKTFNEASSIALISQLKPILRTDKKTQDIADKIVKARPFKSLSEVRDKVTGLGDTTMLRIVDSWLYS